MKQTFLPFLIALMTVGSWAQASEAKYWVNEEQKTVIVATNPVLKATLVKLDVDEDYYGRLDVSLTYDAKDMEAQANQVMVNFPGYRFQRLIIEKQGYYRLQVPSLQVDRAVDPLPGVEGPYLEETIYVTRSQYGALERDLTNSRPLAHVSGKMAGTVPLLKILEHKELSPSLCEEILSDDGSVGGVMERYTKLVRKALDQLSIAYDSTRTALEKDIQQSCFELVGPKSVESFADVLGLQLRSKSVRRSLIGETTRQTIERQEIPLVYELIQTGPKAQR